MNMSILAMLISLAMMLTGVGGEGQPAEASKTLMIHNLSITYNDESVNVDPALFLGAYSNGEKAVFDLSVQSDGEALFPMQLGVDETGLTVLFTKSDVAAKITAEAFDSLTEQLNGMMEATQTQMADEGSAELMNFMMNEYLPAYTGMLEAMQDPEYVKTMQQKATEAMLSVVDRGEGTPVTETYNEQEYALTEYCYTVESDQMAEMIDAIYASDEKLTAYADAMFRMYAMMPEESGLNGITSFKDMFEQTNLQMTMDVIEKVSDDGEVDLTDVTMTIDMNAMIQSMAAAEADEADEADEAYEADETASSDIPELPPMVIYVSGNRVGEHQDAFMNFNYSFDGANMDMNMNASSEGEDDVNMMFSISVSDDSENIGNFVMSIDQTKDEQSGDKHVTLNSGFNSNEVNVGFSVISTESADGETTNMVVLGGNTPDASFAISFDVDVVNGEIEDLANGHDAIVTIDDLSEEAMSTLTEDQAFQAAMMQVIGSMSQDAQKLTEDESVQQLTSLFAAMTAPTEESYSYEDDSFEGEVSGDYEYEEVEDDGVLPYNEPQFTWLPEGWTLESTEVDTAYDWVTMEFSDGETGFCYVTFYADESNPVNYVVGENGDIEAIEGREFTVNDFGDGSLAVSMVESNVYCSMSFSGVDLDVETIGQFVAGIQF